MHNFTSLFAPHAVRLAFWVSYWAWILMEVWIFSRDMKKGSGEKKDRGSIFGIFAGIGGGVTLAFWAPHLWPWAAMPLPYDAIFWTAIAMMWIGIVFRLWSVLTLGKHFRTSVRILDEHKLVTHGPYRFLRHPSYTGGLITITGLGLAFGNWFSLAATFFGALLGYGLRIVVEEAALRGAFGEAYQAHAKRTWAVLPGVW